MKVIWAEEAVLDREAVWDYIARDNPVAASRMDELFTHAAEMLSLNPKIGLVGKIPGTRELLPHPSYRLVYEVEAEAVWILALVHTSRLWPPNNGAGS
jgi:toxin ParE1/3/4